MQLTKSGHSEFLVTLCKIHFEPDVYEVFPVSVFCGKTKPNSVDDYLEDIVSEINGFQENRLRIQEREFVIRIKCIVCDMPARAFVKNTLGHKGFELCERCEIVGHSVPREKVPRIFAK